MSEEIVIFVTACSNEEAEKIARHLVDEGLAACVNIIPAVSSVFRWQGKINQVKETLLIIKSVSTGLEAITKRVKQLHSYQVPEVIALPIIGGLKEYLDWLRGETAAGSV